MTSIGRSQLEAALEALGDLLASRGLHYEVVLIGGGNLILRGLVTRPTTTEDWGRGLRAGSTWCVSSSTRPWIRARGAGISRTSENCARILTSFSRQLPGPSPPMRRLRFDPSS